MLKLTNISKKIGETSILQNINIELNSGEVVALVGPSGSGKTSLLQICGLLDHATSGNIIFQNKQWDNLNDKKASYFRRNEIGFVYQFHHLLGDFNVIENVMLPMLLNNMPTKKAKKRAYDLLYAVGLEEKISLRPHILSGGEKQRAAITRALANSPSLLLADEPTGNLDTKNSFDVLNLIKMITKKNKMSALIATHNLELAEKMDRIIHIKDGKIAA